MRTFNYQHPDLESSRESIHSPLLLIYLQAHHVLSEEVTGQSRVFGEAGSDVEL